MRDLFQVLLAIIAIASMVLIGWQLYAAVRWPILRKRCEIIDKRIQTNTHTKNQRMHSAYLVTFRGEDGQQAAFRLSKKAFSRLRKGDVGLLAYRGRRFKGFEIEEEEAQ